jgi:hypothetical protein
MDGGNILPFAHDAFDNAVQMREGGPENERHNGSFYVRMSYRWWCSTPVGWTEQKFLHRKTGRFIVSVEIVQVIKKDEIY